MLNKIKAMFAVAGIKPNTNTTTELIKTTQEDQRDVQAVKRFEKHFEQEYQSVATRAMMPHGFDCQDNFTCTKQDCWKWQPDKIVSEPYVVDCPSPVKTTLNDYSNKEQRHISTIRNEKKSKKRKCPKGCENKQYLQCFDCIQG